MPIGSSYLLQWLPITHYDLDLKWIDEGQGHTEYFISAPELCCQEHLCSQEQDVHIVKVMRVLHC